MLSLPVCRWRDETAADQYLCRSPKFLYAPNVVPAKTCRECDCTDHEPPAPLPRVLPCVHLGEWTGQRVRPRGSRGSRDLFACVLHGRCTADGTEPTLPGKVRICTHCDDYLPRDPFGPDSGEMKRRSEAFLAAVPVYPAKRYRGRGVVIAGGGDKYFASLYVTVRALRHVGCRLPIQVWYLGRNKEMPLDRQALLTPWQVECVDADKVRRRHPARRLDGWELKVFAALHSSFEELLFLDADSYPCRNPEFLFDLEAYRATGAIFWPECMAIDERLKWPAFGVPDPRRPGSVESGQFVLDKRLSWRPLNLAWFYNDHSDYYYRYCYGDKHTFEVAWTRAGQPFVMFTPTASVDHVGYLHIGPDCQTLFVHRCSDKFRLDAQQYPTSQRNLLPGYYPALPLEKECWGWLRDLAQALEVPVRSPDGAILRPISTPAARITLATLYTPEIAAYGERTTRVLCQYAARHGYRTLTRSTTLDPKRPPSWSKIPLIEQAFAADSPCEWLMWVDADALILRHEIPLTAFLDDDADIIGGDDSPNELLNMGVFFVRNCPAVAELFRRAYAKTEYIHHPWWETPAVMETVREGVPGLRVKVVPRRLFNSYRHDYCEGDFVIHFAGLSHAERVLEIGRRAAPLLSGPGPKARTGGALHVHRTPKIHQDGSPLLREMVSELIVFDSPRLGKIRVGSTHDGGYIVPDLRLETVDFLYAVGVGQNLDFEHAFRALGRSRIKLFDPTIAQPANVPGGAEFFPIGLGVHSHSVATLFQYGQRPALRRHRLWLKMDIEGWEWDALALTAPKWLAFFEVLIIEFHGLSDRNEDFLKRKTACLKKINRRFRLIHAHGNNYASVAPAGEMLLPDCLEATYLRADLVLGNWRPNRNPLPGPLDAPCNPGQMDLGLNSWPFRDLG